MELREYQTKLIDDIRNELYKGKKNICAVLGCGGGKSVIQGEIARSATQKKNEVLFIVHRQELCRQIENTFRQCGVDFDYCTIAMVQTLCRRVSGLKEPKLILVDECHHILSNSYRKIIDSFPNAVVIGFTATPVRMNEGGLGAVFESLVESVSTKWLIENHYLAPYKYYGADLADTRNLHTRNGEFVPDEVELLMARTVIYGSTVENWKKFADGRQTIVYCSSINTSRETARAFKEAGITAAHLDGTTGKTEREQTVADFRGGKIKVLCNVDLFGEGFDVPGCEAVVLLRPTQSLSLHIQQSMRSMRYKPGKTAIILDHVGNYTRHGLPDEERDWSLQQKKKGRKHESTVKTCPNCYTVVPTGKPACPHCGYEFKEEKQKTTAVIEGVLLQEISALPYNDYKKCRTFEELDRFRKAKKYKFYWTIHRAMELDLPIPDKYTRLAERLRAG
jgi:superfamily II DNA or RNA helicase